ncbi:MMPL family transporter [Asanoa iriomotensis]|uniref:Membrane protein n=1 Tax=Asanoa iriomotensis TaxID=234613 RepID=A0ABQ4BUG3_9ACTN|nr:membrane protein [Asanoa iriomotensis]
MLVQVQFRERDDAITDAQRDAYAHTGAAAERAGLRVEHGGEVMHNQPEIGGTEGIGVLVALAVLVVTLGSLVAAGMTMLTALIGVGAGMAGLFALSGVVGLTSTAPILALMLGLAVGIDYSLFITSRYRQHVRDGLALDDAAGRALGTAGSAVLFAGGTVVIALAGLALVGIPFLTVMGLAAAGTVAVAVLVAVTLLPALLGFAGRRVLPRRAGRPRRQRREPGGFRWARRVIRLRVPLLLVGVLGLGALALPALDMRLALPDASTAPVGSPTRDANDLITEGFGPGFTGRLALVVSTDSAAATTAAVAEASDRLAGTPDLLAVTPPNLSGDGRTALLGVLPKTGPTDPATETLVHEVRDRARSVAGADIALTGQTAVGIDVSSKLSSALPTYLLLVVGLSVLLLAVVFRSILVPVKAALGFLLTVGATFGLTTLVFQEGHLAGLVGLDTPGPLVSFLPILLIGILFGLAMDYEVFLVSRMREDFVHGDPPTRATVNGMGHGARVVTAAALIMTAVFAGFVLLDDPVIKSMGFALAIGVAIDAFVVRMTLVPAVMSLLGRAAWWLPRWLDRALPDVDLEGANLRRHLDETAAEPELAGATPR